MSQLTTNEHTRSNVNFFCDAERDEARHVVDISMDDKAHLCQGTRTGMSYGRHQEIFQPSNNEEERQLPKYDFPVSMVNVTPNGYRIMDKIVTKINDKCETEIIANSCYAFVRPKYFLGNTVWASEMMQLRQKAPHKFAVVAQDKSPLEQSISVKSIFIPLHNVMAYYIDFTEKEDVMKLFTS